MSLKLAGATDRRAATLAQRKVRVRALAGRPGSPLGTLLFRVSSRLLGWGLQLSGLGRRGGTNARTPRMVVLEACHPEVPPAFDGYRILHLSDLHCDCMPEVVDIVGRGVSGLAFDLCLITGDYTDRETTPVAITAASLRRMVPHLACADGIVGTLGNHDSMDLLEPLEDMGVCTLVNQTVTITRENQSIHLTGLDDVRLFHTAAADQALAEAPAGFKIAAVHSPEAADTAAAAGYSLYLCGHTHGGQISLPGRPLTTGLVRMRHLHTGTWKVGAMVGYTSNGVGVSNIPLRFNAPPEIVQIVLRRTPSLAELKPL